jgi:hypothetical protein
LLENSRQLSPDIISFNSDEYSGAYFGPDKADKVAVENNEVSGQLTKLDGKIRSGLFYETL